MKHKLHPRIRRAIPVLPYQERWIKDDSQLKIAVWARQTGKSFAAALRAVLKCLERRTQYIVLSKGERQSRLFMEKVRDFCLALRELKALAEFQEVPETEEKAMEVYFPHNRSRIIGLPANPDTARGYSGNVILDEFAFHGDAAKIYAACFPIITRGYALEIISTPNGTAGKFYELAKAAQLIGPSADRAIGPSEHRPDEPMNRSADEPMERSHWSGHRVDIYDATRAGLEVDLELLRAGCDDEETWLQEYECQFLSDAQNYIPLELITSCVAEEATTEWLPAESRQLTADSSSRFAAAGSQRAGKNSRLSAIGCELYLGVDIGRKRDLTIAWLFERLGDVLWSRHMLVMKGTRFDDQEKAISDLIEGSGDRFIGSSGNLTSDGSMARSTDGPIVRRCAVDQSGLGMMLAERLSRKYGALIEPVQFTQQVKERLAPRVKQAFENRTVRIPDNREIRADINSVKRFVTPAGNVRFNAEHTDKGHADRFWALALALNAASTPPASFDDCVCAGTPVAHGLAEMIL